MTDLPEQESFLEDTAETLLEHCQQNAQALILATISLLGDLGIEPGAWADGIGERFAVAWSNDEPWEPGEFLDAMLTNYRSLGAFVEESHVDGEPATAVISGFPDEEICEVFGMAPSDVEVFHRVASEIARRRGLDWQWSIEGDLTRFSVSNGGS